MLNGLFLSTIDGEILLQKELLPSKTVWKPDLFTGLLKTNKELPPCILLKNLFYLSMQCDSVFFVAVTEDQHASPIIICEYLERLGELFKNFIGTITPNAVLSSIGLAYEIISETNDAGSPKLMDTAKLKPLLCNAVTMAQEKSVDLLGFLPENLFGIVDKEKREVSSDASKKPLYSSREKFEKVDELYIDLIEKLSVIINADGALALCNIFGKLSIKSYLDNNALVSLSFPHCINYFAIVSNPSVEVNENSKSLSTTISPGSIDILSYSTSNLGKDISLPFTVYVNITPNSVEKYLILSLKIHCALPVRHPAVNVIGKVPLPNSIVSVAGSSSLKNVLFHRSKNTNEYIFTSPVFPGLSHHRVDLRIYLSNWTPAIMLEMPSIVLQFEVPMFCHSDMKINGLKVERMNQTRANKPINKWVRYLTFSRSYEFRINDDWFNE